MLSIDTNLLLYAFAKGCPEHAAVLEWLAPLQNSDEVVISEFMLVELYRLLRNPTVSDNPLSADQAVGVIETYRAHPRWRVVGFPREDRSLHDAMWKIAAGRGFAYRRIYDARLALTLRAHGVREFATHNRADFLGLGFERVFDPLDDFAKGGSLGR
jgi:toxin-antitoxin system PIN domain toxin